jgi:hypothetical protein
MPLKLRTARTLRVFGDQDFEEPGLGIQVLRSILLICEFVRGGLPGRVEMISKKWTGSEGAIVNIRVC